MFGKRGFAIGSALLALLLAGGIVFVAGCGKDSKTEVKPEAKAEGKSEYWEIVKLDPEFKEIEKKFSNFKYEKDIVVNDTYVVVCGHATVQGKGERQVSFHLKKTNGKWKLADWEDNWGPKDRLK